MLTNRSKACKFFIGVAMAGLIGWCLVFVCLAWFFRVSSLQHLEAYQFMYEYAPPVWKELVLRKIYPGQSAQAVISASVPTAIYQLNNYSMIVYGTCSFDRIILVAKDDVIMSAKSECGADFTFFDLLELKIRSDQFITFSAGPAWGSDPGDDF